MSYLNVPRLHFAGKFQADPSTVNNDPEHFNTAAFQSNYDLSGQGATNGWWNPAGTGAWRLYGCKVKMVTYKDGTTCDDATVDPVIGLSVTAADARVAGKIVDLDPQQQMVSQLWGFQINLGDGSDVGGFKSNFKTAAFGDIFVRYPAGQPDSFFGAFYQSTLDISEWVNSGNSRFLKELEAASGKDTPKELSVKLNVDGFNDDSTSPDFTFGRVVGSIGTHHENEPHHFVAGRVLNSVGKPILNTAYAISESKNIRLDLGNSLPTAAIGGNMADQGQLYLGVVPANGNPVLFREINYQLPGWYEATSGIIDVPLSDEQARLAKNNPLALMPSSVLNPAAGVAPLLAESPNGGYVRADGFVFRMEPGDKKSAHFYATVFGEPYKQQQISLAYDASIMQGQATQGPLPGPQKVGLPQSAFTFPASLTTDNNGHAELQMTASDPGNPRVYIDGQLYGITYQLGSTAPAVGAVQNPSQIINALVYSGFEIPEQPNWIEHIQPIFQQYADLYPVMKPIVDLSNFANVLQKQYILKNVFSMDITNPNYMPVTRDLSEGKRAMIRKWLDNPVYMKLDSAEDLKQALQIAIELEHSTIPPYLCALYSIKQGGNAEVASLIRSVVIEEMLHMALVCNILTAIGGSPDIVHERFVPRYPTNLPGGLRSGLTVRLRKCSVQQIRDCFMQIEEPEDVIEVRRAQLRPESMHNLNSYTIGWFYDEILKSLKELHKKGEITFGQADRQVTQWSSVGKLFAIKSYEDAVKAIQEIKDQGEGSGKTPDDSDHELAHYYKFAEIVEGRHLVATGRKFAFTGAPISFDPEGVWPMMDDPMLSQYPQGSRAHLLNSQFTEMYRALLKGLHKTFNGEPHYLKEAIGLMFSLEIIAQQLMQVPSGLNDGTTAGPTFQL